MTTDRVTSIIVRTSICLLFIMTWGLTGWGKVFGGPAPEWFLEAFDGTVIGWMPGGPAGGYLALGLMELLAAVGFTVALFCGESIGGRAPIMKVSLAGSLIVFLALCFGQRLIGEHDGAAKLFAYFAGTIVALIWLRADTAKT